MIRKTITFIGNSFVEGAGDSEKGGWTKRVAIELTPQWNAIHKGVGGDNIRSVLNRFPIDVAVAPEILVVEVGINDSRIRQSLGSLNEVSKHEFSEALQTLHAITHTKKIGGLVLIGLTPVDESRTRPYKEDKIYLNKEIVAYDRLLRKFARDRHHFFVSLYDEFLARGGPSALTIDGVHPSPQGHALIARTFLDIFRRISSGK